jgi:truncated hemoglobin YjbI
MIGHLFDHAQDWDNHIAKITTFRSSVGLFTGRYHRQQMAAHFPPPLKSLHFPAGWCCRTEGAPGLQSRKVPTT